MVEPLIFCNYDYNTVNTSILISLKVSEKKAAEASLACPSRVDKHSSYYNGEFLNHKETASVDDFHRSSFVVQETSLCKVRTGRRRMGIEKCG